MKQLTKSTIAISTVTVLSMTAVTAGALLGLKRESYAKSAEACFSGGYTRAVEQTAGDHKGEYRCFECITFNPNKPNDPPRFPIDKLQQLASQFQKAEPGKIVTVKSQFGNLSATKQSRSSKLVSVKSGTGSANFELKDGLIAPLGGVIDAPTEQLAASVKDGCIGRPRSPRTPHFDFAHVVATPLGEVVAGASKDGKQVYVNAEFLRGEYEKYRVGLGRRKALSIAEFERDFISMLTGNGSKATSISWPIKRGAWFCKEHKVDEVICKWTGFGGAN